MSTPQDTEIETAKPADDASTPVATSEQKGIAAVSDALSAVFGDLKPDGAPAAPAAESKSDAAPSGEDDGLSAGEIDELLKGLEGVPPKAEGEEPEADKGETPADPFAAIEANWDPDVANMMRSQAAKIAELEKRLEGTPAPTPKPNALEKHLTDTLGPENKLVKPETIGAFARLVDKTALPVARALAAARPPKTPEDFASIEREAINIVVARITNKQPAAPKRAAPPKTIPPGGNAGAPAAHRSALSNAEKGVAAIAKAMATLG